MARKILLADDSVTAQNMGRKILADAGYEVITVNNGSAALKKINEQRPDLIVLDVYMPGYSGLEVCQKLKEAGDTSRIPILLTVGKLEPFKPEEARRAQADGFIVKPFEASELLSALSKLEDKVVPRGETSKTGRFARASAVVEDSRFDKSMSAEHDSSWKTRIVFPKKHKEEPAPEADDAAVYNAVNKDLRTKVDSKAAGPAPAAPVRHAAPVEEPPKTPVQTEEHKVDLGALAPAGFPKDVTPEEIAAIAAAAAQMKGKLTEEEKPEPAAEMPVVAPPVEAGAEKTEATVAEFAQAPTPEVGAPVIPAATFADQAAVESAEKIEEKKAETPASPAVEQASSGLETVAAQPASSGNESWSPSVPAKTEEPVTMALAAAASAAAGPAGPRWTAVAVAVAPEEAGISLEQEMQRMYSAYAAAESDKTAIFRLPEIPMPKAVVETAPAEPAPAKPAVPADLAGVVPAPVVPEPVVAESVAAAPEVAEEVGAEAGLEAIPAPAEVAPEAAETMSAVASAATEAVRAAVAELESVAASYAAEKSVSEKTEVVSAAPVETAVEEKGFGSKMKAEEVPAAEAEAVRAEETQRYQAEETKQTLGTEPEPTKAAEEQQAGSEPVEAKGIEKKIVEEKIEEPVKSEQSAEEEVKEAAAVAEAPVAAAVSEEASDREISEEPAAPARASFNAGGDDMAKRESDTAAAWASWRKIRETGNSKPGAESSSMESEEISEPKDAAMAVAAGAEHSPEDAESLDSDPEIASIVDSVLADMRPKIVEEIARKLGKKK